MLLQIASRPIDVNPTYTVGGEVSRFQRSTVPSRSRGNDNSKAGRSAPSGPAASAESIGPVVRIARGNNVTIVPVGAR
jgi:pilus assembly protein CpaB